MLKIPNLPRHFLLTRHAVERAAQRGITPETLQLLLIHGSDRPAGAGCMRRELLLSEAQELVAEGHPLYLVEAASRVAAIVSGDEEVITCFARDPHGSRGKRAANRHKRRGRRA